MIMSLRRHPARLLLFAAALFAAVYVYARIWLAPPPVETDYVGDILRYYLPNLLYSGGELARGRLPLWNPYEFTGMPMLATFEYAPLYPPNWLYFALPIRTAHVVVGALHLAALLIFLYLFLRRALHVGRPAALFGATAVAFSIWSITNMLAVPDTYRSFVWLPLLLLLTERLVRKPATGGVLALGAVLAIQFFAGETEISARGVQLLCAYLVFLLLTRRRDAQPFRASLLFVLAGALAAGLCAVHIVPLAELSLRSLRPPNGLSFRQAFGWGQPDPAALLGGLVSLTQTGQFVYIGIVSATLSLFAFLPLAPRMPRRESPCRLHPAVWFFSACAIVSFELIRGDASPVAWLYYHLPTGSWFRCPLRFAPFLVLSLGILSALGLDALLRFHKAGGASARMAAACLLAAAAAINAGGRFVAPGAMESLELAAPSLGLLVAALVYAAVYLPRAAAPGALRAGFIATLAASVLIAPWALYPLSDFSLSRQPDLDALPPEVEPFLAANLLPGERIYGDYATPQARRVPKVGTLLRVPCINGQTPFVPPEFWDLVRDSRTARMLKNERAAEVDMPPVGLWGGLSMETGAGRVFNVLGVRYLVLGMGNEVFGPLSKDWREQALRAGAYPERLQADGCSIFENPGAWPRAFVLDHDVSVRELSVEERPTRSARILAYQPGDVTIQPPDDQPGLLVLTDRHYPGMRVYVDGERRPLEKAAGQFLAVTLRGGEHEVRFVYRAVSFHAGAAISVAALLVVAAAAARSGLSSSSS